MIGWPTRRFEPDTAPLEPTPLETADAEPAPGWIRRAPRAQPSSPWGFALLLLFLVVDYGRPQDVIRPLGYLHPALLATVALGGLLVSHSQRIAWSHPAVRIYSVLLAIMAAWVPLATNNYWALVMFQSLLQWLVFALAFQIFIDSPRRFRLFISTWIGTGIFQAFWVVTHHGQGVGAYFGDENDVCLFLNMMIPLALAAAQTARQVNRRTLFYALIALLVVAVVFTRSRGGFLGLLAVVGAIVLLSRQRARLGVLAAVSALLFALLVPSDYGTEMSTINNTQDSTRQQRLRMWHNAYVAWEDNPFLGVGQGNINWVVARYETYDDSIEASVAGRPVHSAYLTALSELGLVGVILYLSLIGRIGVCVWRSLRRGSVPDPGTTAMDPWARATLQALAAYLVCSAFISTLYYPHLYYLLALAMGIERHRSLARRGPLRLSARAPRRSAWAPPEEPAEAEPGAWVPQQS